MSTGHVYKYTSDEERHALVAQAARKAGAELGIYGGAPAKFASTVDLALRAYVAPVAAPHSPSASDPSGDGARLRDARVAGGYTMRALGVVLECDHATVGRMERGERALTDEARAWLDMVAR